MTVRLIVGLGNPGHRYQATRHNLGYAWCDRLAEKYPCQFKQNKKLFCDIGQVRIANTLCYLIKSTNFMNHSGSTILAVSQFYKIPLKQILVIHDDLDLPIGTIRFKINGGHGGHNGLRDIIRTFSADHFLRLRVGIGHPGHRDRVHAYVLSQPTRVDQDCILNGIQHSINLIDLLVENKIEQFTRTLHTLEQ